MAQLTVPVNDHTISTNVGSTATTGPFAVDFPLSKAADLEVYVLSNGAPADTLPTRLVQGLDYTITGIVTDDAGMVSSCDVTLTVAIANTTVTRTRLSDVERLSNFPATGYFSRVALNAELNRITMVLQELQKSLGDTVAASQSPPIIVGPIPPSPAISGQVWFNSAAGAMYVYYDDGTTQQWVVAAPEPSTPAQQVSGVGLDFPAAPVAGQLFSGANGVLYQWNAATTSWINYGRGRGNTTISTSLPPNPFHGQTWWNSTTGQLFVYYDDGSSAQWVAAAPASSSGAMPAGAIIDYAGATPPAGWYLCDGSSKTTAGDPALFAAIGYLYGGSGANFNLPDLQGRVTAGKEAVATRLTAANSGVDGATLGAVGGSELVQAHEHGYTNSNITGYGVATAGASGFSVNLTAGSPTGTYGSGTSQNVQPTAILNKIIKA